MNDSDEVAQTTAPRRRPPWRWLAGGVGVALIAGLAAAVVWWPADDGGGGGEGRDGEAADLFYARGGSIPLVEPVVHRPGLTWEWAAPGPVTQAHEVGTGEVAVLVAGPSAESPGEGAELVILGADGQERWRTDGDATMISLTPDTVTTYSYQVGAQTRTYDLADGRELWSHPGSVIGRDDDLVFVQEVGVESSLGPTTVAVDVVTGDPRWEIGGTFTGAADGTAVFVEPQAVRAYELDSGAESWSTEQTSETVVAVASGLVVVVADGQTVGHALDDGDRLWDDDELSVGDLTVFRVARDRIALAPRADSDVDAVVVDETGRVGEVPVEGGGASTAGVTIDGRPYLIVVSASVSVYGDDLARPVGTGRLILPARGGYYLLDGDEFGYYRAGQDEPMWRADAGDLHLNTEDGSVGASAGSSALITYGDGAVRWFE